MSKKNRSSDTDEIRGFVRERYGAIAEQADGGEGCGCNATGGCCGSGGSYGEKLGYTVEQLASAPAGADLGLGCGNPLAIASIKPGETVLDLGSGAGFDCFLAARQLAGTGKVIGVDMTAAMIAKARANAKKGAFTNVEFRLGEIEALADEGVDEVARLREAVLVSTRKFLAELPAAYREPVRLAEIEGLPLAKIALRMNLSLTAVKARVRRGGARLKKKLQDCCRFEFDRRGQIIGWERRRTCACQ